MRKISFKVRNIGSEKYLSYILNDDCEFDEELLDYLEENRIPELIDIIYEEDDENDYLTYNVTGRSSILVSDAAVSTEDCETDISEPISTKFSSTCIPADSISSVSCA